MSENVVEETKQEEQQWHHLITVDDLGDLKRRVNITYDADGVKMALDKAAAAVGRKVQIKGFRRGKAPIQLVRNYCAKEIETAAATMLSQEGYLHAVYEHKLSALTEPDVEDSEFKENGTFKCSMMVEIRPPITPTGYIGLRLTRSRSDPQPIQDNLINELCSRFSTMEDREEVAAGRTAIVDFEVKVGDEVLSAHEGQSFRIEEGQAAPLGANLIGMRVGESRVEITTIPEEAENHPGAEAEVSITLRQVLESMMPSDEELVERTQLDSFDAIIEQISQQAQAILQQQERSDLEEQIVDRLLELHEFEVPSKWIDDEAKFFSQQLGLGPVDKNEEAEAEVRRMATRNVKRTFMLDAIYEAEPGLKVKQAEFDAFIEREARKLDMPAVKLRKRLQIQGRMNEVLSTLKNRKIMDYLLANADVELESEQPGAVEFTPAPLEEEQIDVQEG